MPRVQLLLIARVARVAKVNVKVNAPVNGMFQVAFTSNVQKTRIKCGDPQRQRREKFAIVWQFFLSAQETSLAEAAKDSKAGRDPENPRKL